MKTSSPDSNRDFRARSIHFFISSTLADMEHERNAIVHVMEKLRREYSSKGISIEYVDLRWGVTREAGADNRTMRICLGEIERCRRISPRPNFIFLTGNRYGWLPLPEILSTDEYRRIRMKAGRFETDCLRRAYRLDSNCLPEGRYLRQPSLTDSAEGALEEEVLQMLFNRVYGEGRFSATEHEIIRGVLEVEDAREHVVGYIRDLTGIPEELRSRFTDGDVRLTVAIGRLRQKLEATLPSANIYYTGPVPFTEYGSSGFILQFQNEIEIRLRRVMDREIASRTQSETEYLRNLYLNRAENYSRYFYGRERELAGVDDYIKSAGPQYPILIPGESGSGKRAFMSKAIIFASKMTDMIVIP